MWPGGFIYGFFFQKGLYNADSINFFIKNWFKGRVIKRHLSIGVANVLTGAFASFNEE